MTRAETTQRPAPAGQLPPEVQDLVDEVTAQLMTTADPIRAAHEFVRCFESHLNAGRPEGNR